VSLLPAGAVLPSAGRGLVDAAGGFTDAGRQTRQRIEALTDELAAPAYDVLSADELDELIAGLRADRHRDKGRQRLSGRIRPTAPQLGHRGEQVVARDHPHACQTPSAVTLRYLGGLARFGRPPVPTSARSRTWLRR
jgi:hypothetical protein